MDYFFGTKRFSHIAAVVIFDSNISDFALGKSPRLYVFYNFHAQRSLSLKLFGGPDQYYPIRLGHEFGVVRKVGARDTDKLEMPFGNFRRLEVQGIAQILQENKLCRSESLFTCPILCNPLSTNDRIMLWGSESVFCSEQNCRTKAS